MTDARRAARSPPTDVTWPECDADATPGLMTRVTYHYRCHQGHQMITDCGDWSVRCVFVDHASPAINGFFKIVLSTGLTSDPFW